MSNKYTVEWKYSRNQRKHTAFKVCNGEYLEELGSITSRAPEGEYQGNHGYTLHVKGKDPVFGRTVKDLKIMLVPLLSLR